MNQKGILIGLTGPTGAGKSTVANLLRAQGLAVIDADAIARWAVRPGSDVLAALAGVFGAEILRADGALDRPALARRAFSSPERTARLNAITHPAIIQKIHAEIEQAFHGGAKAVVLDAPQLFESGEDKLCDFIVAVTAPERLRIERIMKRDQISEESARQRANAQKSETYYKEHADILVRDYPPFALQEELEPVWARIRRLDTGGEARGKEQSKWINERKRPS